MWSASSYGQDGSGYLIKIGKYLIVLWITTIIPALVLVLLN